MPSFKAVVLSHHFKQDGTARIKIRVTVGLKSRYIDTGLMITRADVTKDLKIKTQAFVDKSEDIIRAYRDKCNKDTYRIGAMDVDKLIDYLTKEDPGEDPDFIKFSRAEIERLRDAGRKGVAKNYFTAINTLERYIGSKQLPVSMITVKFLRDFEAFIRDQPGSGNNKGMTRAPSLYLGIVRALHNKMKQYYNDEDEDIVTVKLSPFVRYKLPAEKATRKRAIEAAIVKKIWELPDGSARYNLAKDCFVLSFCLIGMNSADLYYCPAPVSGYLTYKRRKTSTRRKDEALISVKIQPEIEALMIKYKDPTGERAFNFYRNYVNYEGLNKSINKGLKDVGKVVKVDDLEYYAARHSWATIALNKVRIDKYTVHAALNHVDDGMKVTDIYLDKDWSLINDANRKVIDYIKKLTVSVRKIVPH